jgi:DNA processing protein
MIISLSPNTKAILLLTAPLIAGRGASSSELLSPGEYKRLARHLREVQREPADLLSNDGGDLLRSCRLIVEENRMQRLLGRGFLLSQAVERWQARAISIISRADPEYPRRLKARLREEAPAILYVCGNIGLLESGGLAVVGSRDADEALIEYSVDIGQIAARAGIPIVSGGAKGIDQAAMRGALEAGGKVTGVLSDSLEKASMNRENRTVLIDGQLVLISPYDPNAGFNVGNAMRRNKLIYALADASLVVSSDVDKGGTWSGAIEQLEKLRLVPMYVRSTEGSSNGLDALKKKGALPWPNPRDSAAFHAIFEIGSATSAAMTPAALSLFPEDRSVGQSRRRATRLRELSYDSKSAIESSPTPPVVQQYVDQVVQTVKEVSTAPELRDAIGPSSTTASDVHLLPADALFAAAREVIRELLEVPMKESDLAAVLGVTAPQAKAWLQRLVAEGDLGKLKKPVRFVRLR